MAVAAAHQLRVLARGSGSKLHWGGLLEGVDLIIDLGRLSGVIGSASRGRHLSVGAGTPIGRVHELLSGTGRRLPLDAPLPGATVGGTVATDHAGPLQLRFGTPRNLVRGITFVRADGVVVRDGAFPHDGERSHTGIRYDLIRPLIGSHGTLGVITELTWELTPRPAARLFVVRSLRSLLEARDITQEVLDSQLVPSAVELDWPPRVGNHTKRGGTLAVLFEGSVEGTRIRAEAALGVLGGDSSITDEPPPWWNEHPFGPGEVVLRITTPPADLHTAVHGLYDAAEDIPVAVRGSVGSGIAYATLPASTPLGALAGLLTTVRAALALQGGSCVVLHAPPHVRSTIDLWGPVPGLPLMRRLKRQWDPDRRLAPGRFVAGL